MIFILVGVTILAVFAQIALSSLTILGALPLITMLLICWVSYRYGANFALPLMIISGLILSFFVLDPAQVIMAYIFGGLILALGVYADDRTRELTLPSSAVVVAATSGFIALIYGASSYSGVGFGLMVSYIAVTIFLTTFVWWLMFAFARPR